MIMTTLEPATIEHLDFDPVCESPKCQADYPPATHLAVWHFPCNCYSEKLICTPCVERILGQGETRNWICFYCQTRYPNIGWISDMVTMRPLP